ncbi:MAG TPA: FecR domain-containing protein, partial [Candidatus Dormibacteraeota bacterium]
MSITSSKAAPRRRGGYRLIIVLLVVLLLAGAAFFWLNSAAQAAVNATATLTVYQPAVTVAHNNTRSFSPTATGAVVEPGDSIQTDKKGRAAIQLPDGTITRLAGDTQVTLTSAHFARSGNLHDVSISQKAGRTFTNVQHLIGGASFKIAGQSAVASVRGTK